MTAHRLVTGPRLRRLRPLMAACWARGYQSDAASSLLGEDMRRRPAKEVADYLMPMPSHLLQLTLDDLFDETTTHPAGLCIRQMGRPLPQGHHLVYFPLQTPPSALAPDGADADHSPGPPFSRRLWAGGQLLFRPGWRQRLLLDGRPWFCRETIEGVELRGPPGREKVFVDVVRRHGLGHDSREPWDIEETRTLVFLRDDGDAARANGESPPSKRRRSRIQRKLITSLALRYPCSSTIPPSTPRPAAD